MKWKASAAQSMSLYNRGDTCILFRPFINHALGKRVEPMLANAGSRCLSTYKSYDTVHHSVNNRRRDSFLHTQRLVQ
jgi:hypothetical protein